MRHIALKSLGAILAVVSMVALAGPSRAGSITVTSTLGESVDVYLNGTYFATGAGGDFQSSSMLDGNPLGPLYCVSLLQNINLPGTYATSVTTDGTIQGSSIPVQGAGAIAWLMVNLASSAITGAEQTALQCAIWSQIYGSTFGFSTSDPCITSAYDSDLAALGTHTAPVSDLLWITTYNGDGSYAQPLVSFNSIPEPSSIALCLVGALGISGYCLARRTRAGALAISTRK
jgi:hypothetical protein